MRKKEKKKKKKNAHIVSFDEDDSGTFSANPDQSEQSSKFTIGISDYRSVEGTIEESGETPSGREDIGANDLGSRLSVERPLQREASINSQTSFDRPPSVHSLSSTDLDVRYGCKCMKIC